MKRGVRYKIVARRWFQRTYGNTYHSCRVYKVTGQGKEYTEELIGEVKSTYGYGEQYLQTAHVLLQAAGEFPRTDKRVNGSSEDYNAFRQAMRDHRERFSVQVSDVERMKDL